MVLMGIGYGWTPLISAESPPGQAGGFDMDYNSHPMFHLQTKIE
jgi:hypothetical protein